MTLMAASQICASHRTHVQLPFQMVRKRRRPGQKLFKGWRVFFVFDFLSLVAGVEVVLKLTAKINLLKSIARRVFTHDIVADGVFTEIGRGEFVRVTAIDALSFSVDGRQAFQFTGTIGRRTTEFRRTRLQVRLIRRRARISTGEMVENFLGQLTNLFLRRYFFQHRILEQSAPESDQSARASSSATSRFAGAIAASARVVERGW